MQAGFSSQDRQAQAFARRVLLPRQAGFCFRGRQDSAPKTGRRRPLPAARRCRRLDGEPAGAADSRQVIRRKKKREKSKTMNIITEPVEAYLDSLYKPLNPFLKELRDSCEAQMIPIVLKDAEGLLLQLLRIHCPKRILEIGTAAGYSSICFACACPQAKIVTLELSDRSVRAAADNIKKAGLQDSIWILPGDARESLAELRRSFELEERETGALPPPFDFVFIDGAKGHYREFWEGVMPLVRPGSLIVSDNVLFKGMTASDQFIPERRQKTITNRMRSYLEFLTQTEGVQTAVLPVGDGVAVSRIEPPANEKITTDKMISTDES